MICVFFGVVNWIICFISNLFKFQQLPLKVKFQGMMEQNKNVN